ncbi:T7SS effector LXG polymorphic toxin [Bacillus sonorensis]|uniref:Transposase or phage integrase n=2 Tax=Bacillus sonorensis TaxID=119858 RepID=M5P0T1_9BACI|nr:MULTISPECIES: T7SS effector LXG polymorphic toxin [Bacillus]TWK83476.1 putative ribonuclease YwqJ [Bacillus paralicheniformis]ASB86791.1 Putative ribonuclease YwqJ [Bacillus sonorensis]EME73711.1 transposase or phage integrase [Bacillus sonorensis L12]MBG9914669.1 transposase [Bacillus sonorensis]MCY7858025.1 T7SS effector LXG polymorphic toxin [Bacillus sonorensis]
MKIYEAKTLISAMEERSKQYQSLKEQITDLKKQFHAVVNLGGDFQGEGAEAIKDFYQAQADVADAWIGLIDKQIAFLDGISGATEDVDLSGDTVVKVDFLENDLSNAYTTSKSIVSEQKKELQNIFREIDDIMTLEAFSSEAFENHLDKAKKEREETVDKVNQFDNDLESEYALSETEESFVLGLYGALTQATQKGKEASPVYFDAKAYHSSDIYKLKDEVEKGTAEYLTIKKEQEEARRIAKEQEEQANRPWYKKAWDATCTFTGEVTGYYDYKRAKDGIDPVTGEKLSASERVTAGAMAAAGFIPVVGWAGRAFKGGKAIYKTAKGLNAAEHALDAYKSAKSLDYLKKAEFGIYGLTAANGFGEAATGRDMFGNKLSDEQRKQSLFNAFAITGVGAAARYADKLPVKKLPYNTHSSKWINDKLGSARNTIDKVKQNIGRFEVPVGIRVEQLATHAGPMAGRIGLEKKPLSDLLAFSVKDGGRRSKPHWDPKPEGMSQKDYVAHNGNNYSKEKRRELYEKLNKSNRSYVKEKRVPQDHETFLSGDDFKRTKIRVKGATVYAKDGLYYYRDTLHVGEAAHIEVFDHTGKKHLGEADPISGVLDESKADGNKSISKFIK